MEVDLDPAAARRKKVHPATATVDVGWIGRRKKVHPATATVDAGWIGRRKKVCQVYSFPIPETSASFSFVYDVLNL
jgi:hypothetical protein